MAAVRNVRFSSSIRAVESVATTSLRVVDTGHARGRVAFAQKAATPMAAWGTVHIDPLVFLVGPGTDGIRQEQALLCGTRLTPPS